MKEEKQLISHCITHEDTRVVTGAETLYQDPSVFGRAAGSRVGSVRIKAPNCLQIQCTPLRQNIFNYAYNQNGN